MAFGSGKSAQFELDNSAGSLTDLSTYITSSDLDQTLAAIESTTYQASGSSKTYVVGLRDGKFSLSGNYDPTLDSTMNGTLDALAAGTLATASFQYGPLGTATGNPKYTGESIITDYKVNAPVGGIVTWTATLQITGVLTRAAF